MKKIRLLTVLLLAALITGCSAETQSNLPSGTGSNTEISAAESDTPADTADGKSSGAPEEAAETEEPLPFDLIGLMGEKIKPSEIVKVSSVSGEELTAADLTENNWNYLTCEGFAYAAEPTGLCYTNFSAPEIFDEETAQFRDIPEAAPNEYRRVEPGDKICGLTVTYAKTDLSRDMITSYGVDPAVPGSFFSGCTVKFDGSAEMTGYLTIPPKDDYNVFEGDMFFVPEPGNNVLPVVNFRFNFEKQSIENKLFTNCLDDFYWVTEYPTIYLGNLSTTSADVHEIQSDGRYHHVKITVDDITMSSSVSWFSKVTCSICDLELLD